MAQLLLVQGRPSVYTPQEPFSELHILIRTITNRSVELEIGIYEFDKPKGGRKTDGGHHEKEDIASQKGVAKELDRLQVQSIGV